MNSIPIRPLRHVVLTIIAAALAVGGVLVAFPAFAQANGTRELNKTQQAVQLLSRATFGARPGDVDRVSAIGVDRWLDQQLKPDPNAEGSLQTALAGFPAWNGPTNALATANKVEGPNMKGGESRMMVTMNAGVVMTQSRTLSYSSATNNFTSGKIVRAQVSERQLEEVMTDFWLNHFSVYSGKMPSTFALIEWERDVIRPRAFGKFRDLLVAVAHSPAMLFYLDNISSRSDSLHRTLAEYMAGTFPAARSDASKRQGINENYARELLELHTLGVNGGYTQPDVVDVARALTGWTLTQAAGGSATSRSFAFSPEMHDADSKLVLGHAMAANRGVEDGDEVLEIIATHPATARFIATKLARRFISDTPPASIIDRAAETFTRTDGDIAAVVRTILTSDEFYSRAAFRTKVKSPLELVVSISRALDAPPDTSVASSRMVAQMGEPLFGYLTPEGWPDAAATWMNSGTMYTRLKFGADVASGQLKYLPTAQWSGWKLENASIEKQVDGVINALLGGHAEPETRKLMLATTAPDSIPPGGTRGSARLRELIEIALNSPDFQKR
ncbi:MAG: DUF1800 domain-containing protein [Gemmatimonas sp.]